MEPIWEVRSYRRRYATRESGYHTCEETTGGECIIRNAQKYKQIDDVTTFSFFRDKIILTELFESSVGIVAFGGYIHTNTDIKIVFKANYTVDGMPFTYKKDYLSPINTGDWNNIGFHKEISIDLGAAFHDEDAEYGLILDDVSVEMKIFGKAGNTLEFIGFDIDAISKLEFLDKSLELSFHQKTSMHIPYLYYLKTDLPFDLYLTTQIELSQGRKVVQKSCNRCGRFLPINIENEMSTLSFSLHCKKKAPCKHSTFRAYNIINLAELSEDNLEGLTIESGTKIATYYGHQLECKACKKFFVNAPLNPQRNPQQFKEDGLRRRAIEVLISMLLKKKFVHFEFEHRTKKQFVEHIWNKFGRRCFKCGKKLLLDEMHLDHTMPLAYLYRLDESATCLCSTHNSQKSDNFPIDFYTEDELIRLSKITLLSLEELKTKGVNKEVLSLLVENVDWYFDEFLAHPEYQKVRDEIRTSDKINDSLKRVIAGEVNLYDEYKEKTGRTPKTVTSKKYE